MKKCKKGYTKIINLKYQLQRGRIYIIKIENRITFKCKTGYYLKLLIPETMILLGITRNRTVKDENNEH